MRRNIASTCDACGKSGGKLQRCGRCGNAWFCNRECQIVAARQGHTGAYCQADRAPTHAAADAEVAPLLPAAAEPTITGPGVKSASLAPAATSCHACGKSGGKLLLCSQCKNVWFCNRECKIVARKELGHRGANCRAADGVRTPPAPAAPSPSAPMDAAKLRLSYQDLMGFVQKTCLTDTRIGNLAVVEMLKEASTFADLIGGADGAGRRADADQVLSSTLLYLGEWTSAAHAACSSLRAARASGCRTILVAVLATCSEVAKIAPGEMASAERERAESRRSATALRRMAASTSRRRAGSACRPPRPRSPDWASHTTKQLLESATPRLQQPAAAAAPPMTDASRR